MNIYSKKVKVLEYKHIDVPRVKPGILIVECDTLDDALAAYVLPTLAKQERVAFLGSRKAFRKLHTELATAFINFSNGSLLHQLYSTDSEAAWRYIESNYVRYPIERKDRDRIVDTDMIFNIPYSNRAMVDLMTTAKTLSASHRENGCVEIVCAPKRWIKSEYQTICPIVYFEHSDDTILMKYTTHRCGVIEVYALRYRNGILTQITDREVDDG